MLSVLPQIMSSDYSDSDPEYELASRNSLVVLAQHGPEGLIKWSNDDFHDHEKLLNFLVRISNVFSGYFLDEQGV